LICRALPVAAQQAAQPPADIGTVTATGSGSSVAAPPAPGTAADVAPSRGPLWASQPTSVVGSTFIRENVTPTDNYDRIIQFTPSVQNIEPVGAGLQQNYQETIRGFQYTQFNTTFDGIVLPGLPTNFAPQSESYFLAHDIGSVTVDRGPGTASALGYATFGGTVAIESAEPANTARINPYATYGSYDTKLTGLRLDSGGLPSLGGARGFIDVERISSLGALSGTTTERSNVFGKVEIPVGTNTLITLAGLYDSNYVHTPYGATLAQIRQFGPGYGLNDNPRSQDYRGYNWDNYHTDFEYVGVRSSLGGGWGIDNKAYTNGYYQQGQTGSSPNGTAPNLTSTATRRYHSVDGQLLSLNDDVPGYVKHNDFRDYGDILRITKDTAVGQIRFGVWFDDIVASNYRYQAVLNRGAIPYYSSTQAVATIYNRNYHTELRTEQPYIEWALTPLPGLVITPGFKYTATTRILDAQANSSTQLPANYDQTYSQFQPAIDVRYTIKPGWVAYAQAARGFLAPPINVLYTNVVTTNLLPEETWNYQVGTNYQTANYTLSADAYYIDFSNRIGNQTVDNNTVYSNSGGAIYKGIEFEGTVRVGYGASLYGNYTLNSADLKNNLGPLALTPRTTAAVGVIYHRPRVFRENDLVYGSIIGKFIGPQYTQDTAPAAFPISAYRYADFALGYQLPMWNGRLIDFKLNVNNISDDRSLIGLAGTTSGGTVPLYWTNAGRSVFFTIAAGL
jgi:iron complex outermembrane receptor protein